jgi:hypothetical protein
VPSHEVTVRPGRGGHDAGDLEGRQPSHVGGEGGANVLLPQTAAKRKLAGQATWWFGGFYTGTLDQIQIEASWTPSPLVTLLLHTERDIERLPVGVDDDVVAFGEVAAEDPRPPEARAEEPAGFEEGLPGLPVRPHVAVGEVSPAAGARGGLEPLEGERRGHAHVRGRRGP